MVEWTIGLPIVLFQLVPFPQVILLAIDIGNTAIKFGVFEDGDLS